MDTHVSDIGAVELKRALDGGAPCILLDVRTEGEYSRGHLDGSINIPVTEVSGKALQALPDKQAAIYVYCLSGHRSRFAAGILQSLGYTHVFNLAHGLLEWRAKNYPLTV